MSRRAVTVSKFLARHLRHQPERIGLTLDAAGWASVDELLAAAARAGLPITREELDAAVDAPGKQRYVLDESGTRIRAAQGHSIEVELGYAPSVPPDVLFHGTHPGALDAILAAGLAPMGRRHVHLSADVATARQVGARRGRPVILAVDAAGLHGAGHPFLLADNGVWLTDAVPPERLVVLDEFTDPTTARIVAFLRRIGIPVQRAELGDDCFLPGIAVERGGLRVDGERLTWSGDLLHEAAHVAVAPAQAREHMTGDVAVPGLDPTTLEQAAIPWSYAAALAIGIDPALVFHGGGYRGKSEGLLRTFGFGVYPGAHLLEAAGMTATGPRAEALGVPPYPHMLRWLR